MRKNYIYALVTVFIWATMAGVTKLVFDDLPPLETQAVCSTMATLFLLFLSFAKGSSRHFFRYGLRDYLHMAALGFVGIFLYSALYLYGINNLTSQEACILNYLWPMMIILFSALLLHEPLTGRKLLGVGMAFAGIVVLSGGGHAQARGNIFLGMLACVIAAACYGLFSVLNKKNNYEQDVAMPVFWLVSAVGSGICSNLLESVKPIAGMQWLGLLWLGAFGDGVGYWLWAKALNNAENTSSIAILAYFIPFLSVVFSGFLLGEKIGYHAMLALVLIVGGIAVQEIEKFKGGSKKCMARKQ